MVVIGAISNNEAAIRDIGAGGLQLQYRPENDRGDQWTQINIVSGNCKQILIADVCCQVVYDIKSLMENGTFSGMNVRLCGLMFSELTAYQESALQRLLNG